MKANYVNVLSQNTAPTPNVPVPGPAMNTYSKPQMLPNMNLLVPSSGKIEYTYENIFLIQIVTDSFFFQTVVPIIYLAIPP